MHPVDVARVRMAVQGEMWRQGHYTPLYRSTLQSVWLVARYDGISGLYRGYLPGLFYRQVTHGIRLGMFQLFEDMGLTLDENLEPSWRKSAVSGAICGGAGAFMGSPLQLIKCKLQIRSSPAIAVGHQHGLKTSWQVFTVMYSLYGIRRGIWRAATSNVLRLSIGSAVQMAAMIKYKAVFRVPNGDARDELITVVTASVASSATSAPVISALDMIKSRMYLQPVDNRGRGVYYDGILNCARKIYSLDGMLGFLRGWNVAFTYTLLYSSITLVSWEEMKKLRKHPTHRRMSLETYMYY
ncbi:solute carrier family 25 member 35-like [Ornithodoros turicata]|uniref:solute carrier family 25 member 35-like n=1 Tax=Ornithodoros turicata TaxID=34597 RepID=UPI00313A1902